MVFPGAMLGCRAGLRAATLCKDKDAVNAPYVLYGSYASYYTAKTRSYLRKKGIAFIERLPSHPRFRSYVRPASGSHRIPQLETPDGQVFQDSTVIFDAVEHLCPEPAALPQTPRQRLIAHLLELFASEGLVHLAWRYRWFFEENLHFVKMDFGRSFRPQGDDAELLHYGQVIADRMLSRGGVIAPDADLLAAMEQSYVHLLKVLDAHFRVCPYIMGGRPSAADFAFMGALHAHMGRDPVPLRVMQNNAPRVFRWVEHMNTPDLQSPEFSDTPLVFPNDDAIPETLLPVLAHLISDQGERIILEALAYEQWVEETNPDPDEPLGDQQDQPILPKVKVDRNGVSVSTSASLQTIWLLQRSLGYYATLGDADREACEDLFAQFGGAELLTLRLSRQTVRRNNRFHIAAP